MKKLVIIIAVLLVGLLLVWKFDFLSKQPRLNTNLNNATTTPGASFDQLSQEELFEQSPLYKIVNSSFSNKYTNTEMGFSLMLPDKVAVKKTSTYFGIDYTYKIVIDEPGYENSITDLWTFYPDNKNPARNPNAKSLEDYSKGYPAPDVKNHTVVIHKTEKVDSNVIRQEYSYGSWQLGADNKLQFFAGTFGCDACYFAQNYVRYVYYNSNTKKFFILERMPLNDEFHQSSVAFREKEALAERIAKTLIFE